MARKSDYDGSKPQYTWGTGWCSKEVTEKQVSYMETLAGKAGLKLQNLDQITRGSASGLIDELKRAASGDQHSRGYLAKKFSNFVIL